MNNFEEFIGISDPQSGTQELNHEDYGQTSYGYHEYMTNLSPEEYFQNEDYLVESYENDGSGVTSWIDYQSFLDDTGPISSVAFHDSSELFWIGNQTGRMTSYLHSDESSFMKYSSFLAHNYPILQILTLPKHILSISSEAVRMHTLGGLSISQFKPNITDYSGEIRELTCGTLFEPSGGLFRAESQKYLFLGSSSGMSCAYDLNFHETPLSVFDLEVSSVCVQSSVTYLSVGGIDGKIRLLDPSLRSSTVQHSIDAHMGGISSFSVQSDGMTLISCGFQSRSVNPYDRNSHVVFHPDPIVKIFDMRMLRQITHLALAIPPPCYVKFLPKTKDHGMDCGVLAVSSNGYIQTVSLTPSHDPIMESLNIQYATLNNSETESLQNEDVVTGVDISSNGHVIGVGSLFGVVSIHASISLSNSTGLRVNKISDNLIIPDAHPDPPRHISLDSTEIATALILSNHLLNAEERRSLSSNFMSTPQLRKSHLRIYPRLKVNPELLQETSFQGSVGSTKSLSGFPPNSFLCPQARGYGYAVCDPRQVAKQVTAAVAQNGGSQRTESVGSASSIDSSDLFSNNSEIPPSVYSFRRSPRGKNRIQKYNYSAYNGTKFVGLENLTPNSWTNAVLQFLFAIPDLRKLALETQLSSFHHSMPSSLTGELGFLFDMMLAISESAVKNPQSVSKVVTASNFQRALQVTSEAALLFGIEDKPLSSPLHSPSLTPQTVGFAEDVALSRVSSDGSAASFPSPPTRPLEQTELKSLQTKVQYFMKFLLQQLKKEHDFDSKYHHANHLPFPYQDAISSTFAFESITSTTFLTSQSKGLTTHHLSYFTELVYPSQSSRSEISFSEIFFSTICKTTQMRGWCATSDSYEPCRQMKRIQFDKLQNIFTVLCGDTLSPQANLSRGKSEQKYDGSCWRTRNFRGGPWLPAIIEVVYVPGEDKSGAVDFSIGETYISELLTPENQLSSDESLWFVYDGKTSEICSKPASKSKLVNLSPAVFAASHVTQLSLFGVVSGIKHHSRTTESKSDPSTHTVLHLMTKKTPISTDVEWTLFNDFSIVPCKEYEARTFPEWRYPCILFFMKSQSPSFWNNGSLADSIRATPRVKVPVTILNLNSISAVPCVSTHQSNYHPSNQHPLAFDAEFVSVEVEKVEMDSRGQRIVHDEGRQVIARISILEALSTPLSSSNPQFNLLVDDYILPIEPVVDYVTRFSGLHEEDLNPVLSRHAVVPNRTAYLKLKYFVDCGHTFIGHGLQKDFDIANIFVPPEQILDTVELWRLPNQRKVSLRFLASYLLGMEIQDDLHDSIEDARTAYLLYQRYQEEKAKGDQVLQEALRELYAFGIRTNWTIGLDRISTSPVHKGKNFFHISSDSHPSDHRNTAPPRHPHHHTTSLHSSAASFASNFMSYPPPSHHSLGQSSSYPQGGNYLSSYPPSRHYS